MIETISQRELDVIIANHEKWLKNDGGQRANFSHTRLEGLRFLGDLSKAMFINCEIEQCEFNYCNLRECQFNESNISDTRFHNCNLAWANIEDCIFGASLYACNLHGAYTRDTCFIGKITSTNISDTEISTVHGGFLSEGERDVFAKSLSIDGVSIYFSYNNVVVSTVNVEHNFYANDYTYENMMKSANDMTDGYSKNIMLKVLKEHKETINLLISQVTPSI